MRIPKSIFEKFREKDADAMNILVDEYKNDLYNFCYRLTLSEHDADDLFQKTWIKAIKNAGRYKDQAFLNWLLKICVNQYKDDYRRITRRKKAIKDDFSTTSAKDFVMTVSESSQSAEEVYEKKHIQAMLVSQISRLPEKQKVPIVLFYYQKESYENIADILDIPTGTVKSRINSAKTKLKTAMERELYV